MEKSPGDEFLAKVANMIGDFMRMHSYFEVGEGTTSRQIIIFRNEVLESLPFDERGEIDVDVVIDLLPKAIIPSQN